MAVTDAALLALESAVNGYLALDAEIAQQFSELHGKTIGFDLQGTGIVLYFIPSQNGTLQISSKLEADADCLISGSVFSLVRSHFDDDPQQMFEGDILVKGSTGLAQKFVAILKRVDVDWEEQLSKVTGDIIAFRIGESLRNSNDWVKNTASTLGLNLQEYLQEEARLLPTVFELEEFNQNVDKTRDAVERLQARLQRLQASKKQQDPV